jgi:chaperonin GroES|tara:strand:+ start:839 stop:1141 length:303 start_codon:yes stop_codon:yes gene_type:complete
MKMKPMGDQLLLEPKENENKTKSGIILTADSAVYGYANVVSVGPGLYTQTGDRIPMTCKIGDTVIAPARLLSGKNGNEIELGDKKYVLVRESEISMISNG